jgi:hypothetical protein
MRDSAGPVTPRSANSGKENYYQYDIKIIPFIEPISVGTPSRTLSPIDTTATVNITLNGLKGSDTVDIGLAENSYGITLTGNTTVGASGGILTLRYNGTTTVTQTNPDIRLTVNPSNSSFSVNLSIADGQASNRAIPVTQANIAAFNSYANTAAGRTRHYKLAGNVTLTGSNNWTAICATSASFTGSFDGQGYTIANLSINNTTGNQGMFGIIGNGWVKNLGLTNVSITGNANVGGLVGVNSGTIQNCYTAGTVKGTDNNVGGLVGVNNSFVQKCYSTANVEGKGYTGGIAGSNSSATILDCYATGNVTSFNSGYAGGIAGSNNNDSLIQNCYATGTVTSGAFFAGGVVGNNNAITRNTVALNTTVRVEQNSIGRITGRMSGELTRNYARNSMVLYSNYYGYRIINPGLNTEDGENITETQWNSANWWINSAYWAASLAWDTSVWDIANGRLPILLNMPAGAQNPVVR